MSKSLLLKTTFYKKPWRKLKGFFCVECTGKRVISNITVPRISESSKLVENTKA